MLQRDRHRELLGVALFPLGALAVHQVRYLLAFGSDAPHELAGEGHGYLRALTPWIMLAVALGIGGLLARLARAWRTGEPGCDRGRRLVRLWVLAAAGLLATYVGQELLEGLFATGHPQGLTGILGDGGLWALPTSILVGGVLAAVVRGGRALIAHVARLRRQPSQTAARRTPKLGVHRDMVALARLAPLAGAAAGRAPPSC
jgi:hypothetical protein